MADSRRSFLKKAGAGIAGFTLLPRHVLGAMGGDKRFVAPSDQLTRGIIGVGGIRALEPGYRRVRIDPQAPEGLDWVKVTQETPYGPITVHRQGKHLQVSVPVGVTAEIDGKEVGAGEYAR